MSKSWPATEKVRQGRKVTICQLAASVWNSTTGWRRSQSSYRMTTRTASTASMFELSLVL